MVRTKPVGRLGYGIEFLYLLEELRIKGKLCCKEVYELITQFVQEKQVYYYIHEQIIYLAEVCPYLGFYPAGEGNHTPYCAAKENDKMDPKICKEIWKGKIPYRLMEIAKEENKPKKRPKEGYVFYKGRWIPKERYELLKR